MRGLPFQFVVLAEHDDLIGFACAYGGGYADCGLYLWVLAQNPRGQRFYQRLGASDRGGEISEPPGGGQFHGRRYARKTVPDLPRPLNESLPIGE